MIESVGMFSLRGGGMGLSVTPFPVCSLALKLRLFMDQLPSLKQFPMVEASHTQVILVSQLLKGNFDMQWGHQL